jgi:hypothetical protein
MAVNDERGPIVIQFAHMLRDRAHGDEARPFDAADGVLFRLPNVYQAQGLAVIKAAFYLAGTDLQGKFGHDEMVAVRGEAKRIRPEVRLTPLLYSGVKSPVSNRFYRK